VTFRIADLTNPILKPWAIEKMREQNELAAVGKRAFEARASCRPGGVPGFLVIGRAIPLYFVQGKDEVLLINEGGPEVRRVFLNVPHSAHPKISPYGESVGHYEGGDTLVVDTIGLSGDTYVDNYRTPHTMELHVVERFQLTEGGKDAAGCDPSRRSGRVHHAGGRDPCPLAGIDGDPECHFSISSRRPSVKL
jgi:hypothetical protein